MNVNIGIYRYLCEVLYNLSGLGNKILKVNCGLTL
jgi:hypothetical protein